MNLPITLKQFSPVTRAAPYGNRSQVLDCWHLSARRAFDVGPLTAPKTVNAQRVSADSSTKRISEGAESAEVSSFFPWLTIDLRNCASDGSCDHAGATNLGRSGQRELGRFDEYAGRLGITNRAEVVPHGIRNLCHHARRYPPIGSIEHSRFAANGARTRRGPDQFEYVGDQRPWIERALEQ